MEPCLEHTWNHVWNLVQYVPKSFHVPSIFDCAIQVHGHWCSGLGSMVFPKPLDPGGEGEHGPGSVDPLYL